MTIPRRLSLVDGRLHQDPALDGLSMSASGPEVTPDGASGVIVTATGTFEAVVGGDAGDAVRVTGGSGTIRIERRLPRPSGGRPDLTDERDVPWPSGAAVIVVDHGTVELFVDGRSASMMSFPGLRWEVRIDGDATCVEARPTASSSPEDQ